jgi:hypothetical protein
MRTTVITALFILFVSGLNAQHDTLVVFKLKLVPDTTAGGVRGVSIMLSMKHIYDTIFHGRSHPSTIYADIEILTAGKNVTATKKTSSYRIGKGNAGYRVRPQTHGVTVKNIHIPYYALDVTEGKHQLNFCIKAWQNDTTTFAEKVYRIPLKYDSAFSAMVNIPPKEYFKVLVSGVRAMETDFDGKQWDYNMISGAPPDIVWKVMTSEGERTDYLFVSPMMKNSYSAAWLDDSGKLCLSKGDKFYIKVYDNDPLYDDLMASEQFTTETLIELSQKNKEIQTGRLTYFKLTAERVE